MSGVWAQLREVSACFGAVTALSGINLRIRTGESVALVGGNGSGKSTLLRLLHGLVPPSAGEREIDPAQTQAMVFQRPYVLRASAQNNVALGLWLRGLPWAAAREQALVALAQVGLADLPTRMARTLSGGQQQRLAMARAWALKPSVLLLDEPTASLDPHAKREVEGLMAQFQTQASQPLTLVFASHNLGQVKRLAQRVIYLEQGRLLADLPVSDFFDADRLRAVSASASLFVQGEL